MARETRTAGKAAAAAKERTVSREAIATVAYELFERRGREPGHDFEDWLRAEQIVRRGDKG